MNPVIIERGIGLLLAGWLAVSGMFWVSQELAKPELSIDRTVYNEVMDETVVHGWLLYGDEGEQFEVIVDQEGRIKGIVTEDEGFQSVGLLRKELQETATPEELAQFEFLIDSIQEQLDDQLVLEAGRNKLPNAKFLVKPKTLNKIFNKDGHTEFLFPQPPKPDPQAPKLTFWQKAKKELFGTW